MSEQPGREADAAQNPVTPPARLAPPTRAVERSSWAEEYVTAASAPTPRRGVEPTPQQPEAPSATERTPPTLAAPGEPVSAANTPTVTFAQDDAQSDPGSTAGLGEAPVDPIETLPPITATVAGWPISERTGELRRSGLVVAVCGLLSAGAVVAAGTYWWYWWTAINITDFASSSWLISWFDPRPGSGLSILLVTVMTMIGIVMTAMPAMAAYNAWEGSGWSRRAGLIATLSGLGALFVMPAAWIGFGMCAAGFALMWLPGFRAWLDAWEAVDPHESPAIVPPSDLPYGPLPRFR